METKLDRVARYLNVALTTQSLKGTRENTRVVELFANDLKSEANYVEVTQWLAFAETISGNDLSYLDALLLSQSFIVGAKLSLADVVVFDAIVTSAELFAAVASYKNVCRWMETISVLINTPSIHFQRAPTLLPFISAFGDSDASGATTTQQKPEKAGANPPKDAKDTKEAKGDAKGGKDKEKKEKAPKEESKPTAAAPATATAGDEDLDPSKLDIRVGIVRKCWNHPDSEKLLCEEVDIGEEKVRQIGSGLRHFYTAEAFEGRKVLVLANLKERALGGFPSHGMVLCTSNPDHTQVELLVPPASSKPGDRVIFEGYSGEPAPAAQVAKKKLLEKLAPELKTNEGGVACWRSSRWTIGSEPCTSSMGNSNIS